MTNKNENDFLENLMFEYKTCGDLKKKEVLKLSVVEAGLDLVKRVVYKLRLTDFSMREDLLQIGALGLIKAIDNYDINNDAAFATFAYYHIQGNIRHYLRDKVNLVHFPRSVLELGGKVSKMYEELKSSGVKDITPELLAQKLNTPVDKIIEVMTLPITKNVLSLEQLRSCDDDNLSLVEKISEEDYNDKLEAKDNYLVITEAFDALPADMKTVIKMSFFEGYNQRQIADKLGISQMQVSRVVKKALVRMYEYIKKRM